MKQSVHQLDKSLSDWPSTYSGHKYSKKYRIEDGEDHNFLLVLKAIIFW